jgi:hypothetical protein
MGRRARELSTSDRGGISSSIGLSDESHLLASMRARLAEMEAIVAAERAAAEEGSSAGGGITPVPADPAMERDVAECRRIIAGAEHELSGSAPAGDAGGRTVDEPLRLSLHDTIDQAPAGVDPEITPRTSLMVRHHAAAQLEHVRNAMVLAKRGRAGYASFLKAALPGDYHNEFVAACRRNERWHQMWSECTAADALGERYTCTGNRIDVHKISAQLDACVDNADGGRRLSVPPPSSALGTEQQPDAPVWSEDDDLPHEGGAGSPPLPPLPPATDGPWQLRRSRRRRGAWYFYNANTRESRWPSCPADATQDTRWMDVDSC